MSDAVKTAEANVADFRKRLNASLQLYSNLNDAAASLMTANIEGLILAHIQKTIAQAFGGLK